MKIAATYEDGNVFQHFGHTEQFKIYTIEDGKITDTEVIGTNGNGHEALAGFLDSGEIKVLVCGGIGGGAINALMSYGIQVVPGAQGNADEAVQAYLDGKLAANYEANCSHHQEGQEGGGCHCH